MTKLLLPLTIVFALSACGNTGTPAITETPLTGKDATGLLRVNGSTINQGMVSSLLRQRGLDNPTEADNATAVQDIEKVMLMAQEGTRRNLDQTPKFVADMVLLRMSRLADFTADKIIDEKPITDAEIQAEYDAKVSKIGGAEFQVRQMLFKTEADALTAIGELLNGADFAATGEALTKGKDGAQAGDLGWINLAQVPPEFAPVLPTIAVGDFTKVPLKTAYGFHVLKVNQTRPLSAPNFDEVKPGIKQTLQKRRVEETLQALKKAATIEPVTG